MANMTSAIKALEQERARLRAELDQIKGLSSRRAVDRRPLETKVTLLKSFREV